MPVFPVWIPITITALAFLWIVVLGRFFPGYKDDISAFLVMIGVWLVYGVSKSVESFFSNLVAGNMVTIVIALVVIIGIVIYIKYFKK